MTRKVNGASFTFQRFTLDDIESFGTKMKESRAAANDKLADKHKLDAWQRFRADQELEHAGISVVEVLRHLRSTAGVQLAITKLAEVANLDSPQTIALKKSLGPTGVLELITEAISVPPSPPEPESSGPQSPNA